MGLLRKIEHSTLGNAQVYSLVLSCVLHIARCLFFFRMK